MVMTVSGTFILPSSIYTYHNRIGVKGFRNITRDSMTVQCLDKIEKGCKLKMDDSGNILVKRLSDASIHANIPKEENTVTMFKRNLAYKGYLGWR